MTQDIMKQAPKVVNNGDKKQQGSKWSAIRPIELEHILFTQIDARNSAELRIMLALTGSAEGFAVSQKWIENHTGVSHSSYIRARANLVKRGWITHTAEDNIIVNYDAIYACGEGSTVEPSQGSTVELSQGSTVELSQGSTVEPIIKEEIKEKEIKDQRPPMRKTHWDALSTADELETITMNELNRLQPKNAVINGDVITFTTGSRKRIVAAID